MARALKDDFFKWLQNDGHSILEIISSYQCLSIRFSGNNTLKVYFKGFLILTLTDSVTEAKNNHFKALNKAYYEKEPLNNRITEIISNGVCIANLQEYLDCVIGFLSRRDNSRLEESIRQEIAQVNNLSREANDTDYFIVDQEYNIGSARFDLVALKWPSKSNVRKNFNGSQTTLEIVVFELKQGLNAIGGTKKSSTEVADLKHHFTDFTTFADNGQNLLAFKKDIIKMFVQQASLSGFYNAKAIKGLKHVKKLSNPWNDAEIEKIANNIPVKFGIIISDYKIESKRLKEQLEQIDGEFIFATASFMGYGLYENSMMNNRQILNLIK